MRQSKAKLLKAFFHLRGGTSKGHWRAFKKGAQELNLTREVIERSILKTQEELAGKTSIA